MPDRLSELVRQRALVSEHLAWLDREIAMARSLHGETPAGANEPAASAAPPAQALPSERSRAILTTPPASTDRAGDVPAETETLLEQYRVAPSAVKQDVRKGCLLYFIGAFVVLGIVIAVLYFTIGTR